MQSISKQFDVSALTGNLSDFGDNPSDLFEKSAYFEKFFQSRIGIYGGEFYDSHKWPSFPPLFFPKIGPDFIEIGRNEELFSNIVYSDAVGMFVGDLFPNSVETAFELLNKSLEGHLILLSQLAKLFKIVLVSNADGDFFTLYANQQNNLNFFQKP
ncbi:MAG: hypothetical protein IPN69_18890 [Acidobacteria bacterium]|nr:hypothetical protein [Acidobacteriota bacterium]